MVTLISDGLGLFTQSATAELGRGTLARQVSIALPKEVHPQIWPNGDLATAVPSTVALGFLRDGRLRVREAIEVAILEADGQIVAEADELNEFGSGDNQSEAVIDLQHAIAELYFSLEEDKDRLGPGLQKVWEVLQVKIEKR